MGKKIVCQWIQQGNKIMPSSECSVIDEMVDKELIEVASRGGGWIKLYKHKSTGEYWELDFPLSHMHGGGPPVLENLDRNEVKERYGIDGA